MAEPKKRMSVTRSKNRRRNQHLAANAVSVCPKCGKGIAAHQTCRTCLTSVK